MNYGCFAHLYDGYRIKKSGYDSIELNLQEINTIGETELAKYAKEYESLGLTVYSVSWILPTEVDLTSPKLERKRWLEYLKRGAERCAELGVCIWPFGCGYGRSIKPGNKENVASQIARVNSFIFDTAEICSKYDIKLALEPLGPRNSNYIQTLAEADEIIKRIAHPSLFLMCDFRHMCATSDDISRIADYDDYSPLPYRYAFGKETLVSVRGGRSGLYSILTCSNLFEVPTTQHGSYRCGACGCGSGSQVY